MRKYFAEHVRVIRRNHPRPSNEGAVIEDEKVGRRIRVKLVVFEAGRRRRNPPELLRIDAMPRSEELFQLLLKKRSIDWLNYLYVHCPAPLVWNGAIRPVR
jgi:hypothetical protein